MTMPGRHNRLSSAAALAAALLVLAAAPPAGAQPGRDAFGDPLPPGCLARFGTARWRFASPPYFLRYLLGGKHLLTATEMEGFQVWDVRTAALVCGFGGPPEGKKRARARPDRVALAAGGKLLFAGENDGTVRVWDVATGKEVRRFNDGRRSPDPDDDSPEMNDGVRGWLVSPDGEAVWLLGHKRDLREVAATHGEVLRTLEPPALLDERRRRGPARFLPSRANSLAGGRAFVSLHEELRRADDMAPSDTVAAVTVWDAESGEARLHFQLPQYSVRDGVALSADCRWLAAISAERALLFDLDRGGAARELDRLGQAPGHLDFSPDGKILAAVTDDNAVHLWDVATGKATVLCPSLTRGWSSGYRVGFSAGGLTFSPDGATLAAATRFGTVRFWDVASGKEKGPTDVHQGQVDALAVSADGGTLTAHATDGRVHHWRVATGEHAGAFALPRDVGEVLLSPAGDRAAYTLAGEKTVTLHLADADSGEVLWQVTEPFGYGIPAFSADGRAVALRNIQEEHTVTVRRAADGKKSHTLFEQGHTITYQSGPYSMACVAFTPGGRELVTSSFSRNYRDPGSEVVREARGGFVRVWDLAAGRPRLEFDAVAWNGFLALVVSPDGRFAAVTRYYPRDVELWELASGKRCGAFPRPANEVRFSPDGRVAAGAGLDGVVYVWDVDTGKEIAALKGHRGEVLSVAFAPDGRGLFSGGADTTVLLWDLKPFLKGLPEARPLGDAEAKALWDDLADEDAAKARAAVVRLSRSPREALALLGKQLRPAPAVTPKEVARWIGDLDSPEFEVRESAEARLAARGWAAEPALRAALTDRPGAEVKQRVERVLESLGRRLPPGAEVRPLRAVDVLERVGDDAARKLLQALADGAAGELLTEHAKEALARSEARPR
jgi:WD40 repeat protein